jgi:hypothetical protein
VQSAEIRSFMKAFFSLVFVLGTLTACGVSPRAGISTTVLPAIITKTPLLPTDTPTIAPSPAETQIPSPTPNTRIPPVRWQEWPVIPTVQPEMTAIFQRGVDLGNNPLAFTKIGDGEISTVWFLSQYDDPPPSYHLGIYTDLQSVINRFSGSFGHVSLAAGAGFNTAIILGLAPAGTPGCQPGETRLSCELNTYHPSFALLSLGTNQVWQPNVFESGMQQIIEILLKAGVVPILSTKADNLEGNFHINRIIARLADKYNLPLWNFWLAVQPLPEHGLQPDLEHLTFTESDFNNPKAFQFAWPIRNLTALQVLSAVSQVLTSKP